jgi:hypothetical protein
MRQGLVVLLAPVRVRVAGLTLVAAVPLLILCAA